MQKLIAGLIAMAFKAITMDKAIEIVQRLFGKLKRVDQTFKKGDFVHVTSEAFEPHLFEVVGEEHNDAILIQECKVINQGVGLYLFIFRTSLIKASDERVSAYKKAVDDYRNAGDPVLRKAPDSPFTAVAKGGNFFEDVKNFNEEGKDEAKDKFLKDTHRELDSKAIQNSINQSAFVTPAEKNILGEEAEDWGKRLQAESIDNLDVVNPNAYITATRLSEGGNDFDVDSKSIEDTGNPLLDSIVAKNEKAKAEKPKRVRKRNKK